MYGHILIIQEKWGNYHFISVQLYLSRNSSLKLGYEYPRKYAPEFFIYNLKS